MSSYFVYFLFFDIVHFFYCGDPLGLKQSGFPAYRFADPIRHRSLMLAAADDARLIMNRDPDLTSERGQAVQVLEELFDWKNHKAGAS